jgi:hypothetical protein
MLVPDSVKNFETARTRHFRTTELHPTDENTISQIEQHGCSVLSVGRDCRDELGWTYTIGVNDTSGKPDLITVGLPFKTAQVCLNEAVKRQRTGVDLTKGRQSELIGNVDCEFRPVDQNWVKHLMNWANWYYGGTNYPVLQAIYPDLENRFPEDQGFNGRFAQPLMQPEAAMGPVEKNFWDSIDELEKFRDWRFPDPPHTGAYISKAVQSRSEPVTYVSHDADDGAWQFLGDTMTDSGGVLVCLHHPIDDDPSLAELADLPLGWCAERDAAGEPWCRCEHPPEDNTADAMDSEAADRAKESEG